MNILLKQGDIEKAVREYIERQGIQLHNKTLAIAFNMGRGGNGLAASLTIEDNTVIPGFTDTVGDAPVFETKTAKAVAAGVSIGEAINAVKAITADSTVAMLEVKTEAAPVLASTSAPVLTTVSVEVKDPAPTIEAEAPVAVVVEVKTEAPAEAEAPKTTTNLFG